MSSELHFSNGVPDTALMLRVKWGDEGAFSELYRRYHRKVMDFFYGMSRDPGVSEELCQETFLRIWKLRRRYAAAGSFQAYLFAFARNVWLEKSRQIRKQERVMTTEPVDDDWQFAVPGRSNQPDQLAALSELEERIFNALDGLPEEQRMAFIMRIIEGLSIEEIASAMQCPINTVRSRKLLAIKKLRKTLRGIHVL